MSWSDIIVNSRYSSPLLGTLIISILSWKLHRNHEKTNKPAIPSSNGLIRTRVIWSVCFLNLGIQFHDECKGQIFLISIRHKRLFGQNVWGDTKQGEITYLWNILTEFYLFISVMLAQSRTSESPHILALYGFVIIYPPSNIKWKTALKS